MVAIVTDNPNVNQLFRVKLAEKFSKVLGTYACASHITHNLAKDILKEPSLQKVGRATYAASSVFIIFSMRNYIQRYCVCMFAYHIL